MINVLFSALPEVWDEYRADLPLALERAGLRAKVSPSLDPAEVDYIVFAPNGPVRDFSVFPKCKAVLSLWAGVETVVGNATLTQPLARMVDSGLRLGMTEYVVGHVLRYHLGLDRYIRQNTPTWDAAAPPLAKDRPIAILGIGELGIAAGEALTGLGFPVRGWSRSAKSHATIDCYHRADGLREALKGAQGVVLLLPNTPATSCIFGADEMAQMARGAFVINPGRGSLIDDDALLAALDSGQIGAATLDVFRTEPLPSEHPFWAHPSVTVTPHIASTTRSDTASEVIAENIRRSEANLPLLNLVDRTTGY